jgi:peptide chain release factor 2
LNAQLAELETTMAAPDFWNDQEHARELIDEANGIKRWTEPVTELEALLEEAEVYLEMGEEDEEAARELEKSLEKADALLQRLESQFMLGGKDDPKGALIEIHPGAGGTDSQDWAEMLLRMYSRFCEAEEWSFKLMEVAAGEEAGIKSATLEVTEDYAYGYLKGESGVHRLVRISPFDAQSRRHTAFASVFVYPLVEDQDFDVEIEDKDLRVDTYRASGAGGQHVNKTDSAIRITHLPTNIVVQCQNERSQHRNREAAMKMLRTRLYHLRLEEEKARQQVLEDAKMKIDFGSQIRSYVLHPYTKVKDHRTEVEKGDARRVLDGDLKDFIDAYLRMAGQAV